MRPKKARNEIRHLVIAIAVVVVLLLLTGCNKKPQGVIADSVNSSSEQIQTENTGSAEALTTATPTPVAQTAEPINDEGLVIPAYSGKQVIRINENRPFFHGDELKDFDLKEFSELDELGRCGPAIMMIRLDTLGTGERGNIGMIKPTGWHQNKYPGLVDSEPPMLMNRGHLIGWKLSGENDNELNLISMTRSCNTAMIPYETAIANYVEDTCGYVLYRVTPYFEGDNLFATGVLMEAKTILDDEISFCVFIYNVQDGIYIDYTTGENHLEGEEDTAAESISAVNQTYILNKNSKKFHLPSCSSVSDMKPKNRKVYEGTREEVIEMGYEPCGLCGP